MATIAMFPLGSVLLPGMLLPLHVFEPRYRTMLDACLAGDRRFGVTLIERGSEVGGGDIRAMVGTVAEIVEAEQADDGRWAVLAVGVERVRVTEWLPDDPFPQAQVEPWPDEAGAGAAGDAAGVEASYRACEAQLGAVLSLVRQLGVDVAPEVALSDDPQVGSYQIAVLAPLGAWDRQQILLASGTEARLALLAEMLSDQELMIAARLAEGDGSP